MIRQGRRASVRPSVERWPQFERPFLCCTAYTWGGPDLGFLMIGAVIRAPSRAEGVGVGAVGREGEILARVVIHSLILTALMGLLAMLQTCVVPQMVPKL